ncbi:MAG: NAD-dependent epimerase/dehydratase family protein [Ignavibacteria bacterium]|nr:NAD-dependent epimerase/dehydratase family protein [Ignavibacteria bacterium]
MNQKFTSLVTGASGFVGSHLVDKLLSLNHQVRIIARKESKLKWVDPSRVEIFTGDYSDINFLRDAVKNVDYIFHVAGVIKSKKKEGYYKGNVEVTKNLLSAVKKENPNLKRFLFVSSQAAAGPSPEGFAKTEDMECNPVTTYGKSKLMAENEVKKFTGIIPFTIVRPSAVYGPRDPEILMFFQTLKKGIQPMVGFREKYVSLVHVSDLIDGILLAAFSDRSINQTYFISSEKGYGWEEIGNISSEILGKKVIKIKIPHFVVYLVAAISQTLSLFSKEATILNLEKAREMVQSSWVCSVEKAKKELGYNQKISIEEGIRETINWYLENKWL